MQLCQDPESALITHNSLSTNRSYKILKKSSRKLPANRINSHQMQQRDKILQIKPLYPKQKKQDNNNCSKQQKDSQKGPESFRNQYLKLIQQGNDSEQICQQKAISGSLEISNHRSPMRNAVISQAQKNNRYYFHRKIKGNFQRFKTTEQVWKTTIHEGPCEKLNQEKKNPNHQHKRLKSYKEFLEVANSTEVDDFEISTFRKLAKLKKKKTLNNQTLLNLSYDGKKQPIHSLLKNKNRESGEHQKIRKNFQRNNVNSLYTINDFKTMKKKSMVISIIDSDDKPNIKKFDAPVYKPKKKRSDQVNKNLDLKGLLVFRKQSQNQEAKSSSKMNLTHQSSFTPWTKREKQQILNNHENDEFPYPV